ncbi:MAG: hypothetical protein AAF974_04685 [Cyanobacteria bacterium P01_E01_bin.34]
MATVAQPYQSVATPAVSTGTNVRATSLSISEPTGIAYSTHAIAFQALPIALDPNHSGNQTRPTGMGKVEGV